jgi:L-aspartate oxidase
MNSSTSIADILPIEDFKIHFPNIYEKCLAGGIEITVNMIPVVPACHYFCGGIMVRSTRSYFPSIDYTQPVNVPPRVCYGANRLGLQFLLEGLVYGHNIAREVTLPYDD